MAAILSNGLFGLCLTFFRASALVSNIFRVRWPLLLTAPPLFLQHWGPFSRRRASEPKQSFGYSVWISRYFSCFYAALLNQNDHNEWGAFLRASCLSLSYAAGMLYTRTFLTHIPSMLGAASQVLAAAQIITPAALFFERPWEQLCHLLRQLWALPAGAFWHGYSFCNLYYKLNKTAGPTYTSTSTLLFPAIAVLLGV